MGRSEGRALRRARTHEDAKRARRAAPCTRALQAAVLSHAHGQPSPAHAPCPALAFSPPLRPLATATGAGAEGGRPSTRSHSCSSLRCAPRRRALSVARARRAPVPAPSPAPLLLPRRHAAQQRALPRARLRVLSASASATLFSSIVVVDDGAEKGRRCGPRRCPFPRRGLRSWTSPCALFCVPASTPCARAPGLPSINITGDPMRTIHRRSVRSALGRAHNACSSMTPSSPLGTSTRPHPIARPFSCSSASSALATCVNAVIGGVAPHARCCVRRRQRGVPLHERTGELRRCAALGSRRARCAWYCVLLRQSPATQVLIVDSSFGAPFSTRSRRGEAGACLNAATQPGRPVCAVSALVQHAERVLRADDSSLPPERRGLAPLFRARARRHQPCTAASSAAPPAFVLLRPDPSAAS